MKKIWIAAVACMLALCVPMTAKANGTFLEGYGEKDGQLQIFCSDIVPEEETAENISLTLGGQKISVLSVESEKEIHTPVTYYCLADVSGSMNKKQMNQIREVLTEIADGLQEGDNMVIGALANETNASDFLADQEALGQLISDLAATGEDTNLYAGLVEGLRILQTDTNVNPRKCLVILSDGEDYQKGGITKEEAEQAVTDSSIPVYTVAVLRNADNEEMLSYAKLLGSFARMSTGGAHFAPVVDNITGAEAGQSILRSMAEGLVVTAQTEGDMPDRDTLLLRMVYTSAEGAVYEDTMELYTEDLPLALGSVEPTETPSEPSPSPDPVESSEPSPSPDPAESRKPEGRLFILLGILTAVVLLVVIVIAIILKKNKNNRNGETEGREQGKALPEGRAEGSQDNTGTPEETQESGADISVDSVELQESSVEIYELRLYAIGYPQITRTIRLERGKEVTVGRNSKADVVLDGEDRRLSSVHCKMKWEDGKLYVLDMGSTNGTFVNGVPIRDMGRVVLRKGETIRIGSYEYRVGIRDGECEKSF